MKQVIRVCLAVLVGLAASLKLYPAILGACYLAKKEWKEAAICFVTGFITTFVPLFFFQGGFIHNLQLVFEKTVSYAVAGNGKIEWLVDDKNSFYQLFLIPKMLGATPLADIDGLKLYVSDFRYIIIAFSVLVCLLSFLFESNANRILLLTMVMIGFPIESGAYNLILVLCPLVYWCLDRSTQHSLSVLIPGVLLITMKSFVSIKGSVVSITPQAILNPLLELMMIVMLIWMERDNIKLKLNIFIHCLTGRIMR